MLSPAHNLFFKFTNFALASIKSVTQLKNSKLNTAYRMAKISTLSASGSRSVKSSCLLRSRSIRVFSMHARRDETLFGASDADEKSQRQRI